MSSHENSLGFAFDEFVLDLRTRCLLREGQPVPLTAKQFDVLEYLVRNAGRVLTKQEMLRDLWPDSFVEEGNLSQNIFWLRKALRNGAPETDTTERYILTVQGRGYRFIAPVRPLPSEHPTAAAQPLASPAPEAQPTPKTIPAHWWQRRWVMACLAIAVVATGVGGTFAWRSSHRVENYFDPVARPEVIITQIEDATHDETLVKALNSSLRRGIFQSPYVVILPRTEINKTLGYMQLPLDTPMTAANARAVCLRRNSTATVQLALAPESGGYLITLEADNCVTGKAISVGRATAANGDQLLVALDSLLAPLRRDLGESATSVRQFNVPVENATTASLEAFKAYLAAEDLRAKGETVKAVPLLKRALSLDPNFAMAHAALGTCYMTTGENDAGNAEFTKAYELSPRISARERFYLEYFYVKVVQGDLPRAVALNADWMRIYPRDPAPYTNGPDTLTQLDRYEEAIQLGELGIRKFPEGGLGYVATGFAAMRAGRFDEVKRLGEAAVANHVDGWQMHEILWERALVLGDAATAAKERAWVNGSADEYLAVGDDVSVQMQQGKLHQAQETMDRFLMMAKAHDDTANQEDGIGYFTYALKEFGLGAKAAEYLHAHAASTSTFEVALTHAASGERGVVDAYTAQANQKHAKSTVEQSYQVPILQAELSLAEGHPAEALQKLQPTVPLGLRNALATYIRGKADLQAGRTQDASREFQTVVDHPSADVMFPLYPVALLQLARTQAALGHKTESRTAYARLARLWENADPDIPLVQAARREWQ